MRFYGLIFLVFCSSIKAADVGGGAGKDDFVLVETHKSFWGKLSAGAGSVVAAAFAASISAMQSVFSSRVTVLGPTVCADEFVLVNVNRPCEDKDEAGFSTDRPCEDKDGEGPPPADADVRRFFYLIGGSVLDKKQRDFADFVLALASNDPVLKDGEDHVVVFFDNTTKDVAKAARAVYCAYSELKRVYERTSRDVPLASFIGKAHSPEEEAKTSLELMQARCFLRQAEQRLRDCGVLKVDLSHPEVMSPLGGSFVGEKRLLSFFLDNNSDPEFGGLPSTFSPFLTFSPCAKCQEVLDQDGKSALKLAAAVAPSVDAVSSSASKSGD